MALVIPYDLELHQIDVKIAFLNVELKEEVFIDHMACKLRKSIHRLK